jgi:hypothetical protein
MVVPPVKYWTAFPVKQVMAEATTPAEVVQVEIRPGLTKAVPPDWVKVPPLQAAQTAPFMKAVELQVKADMTPTFPVAATARVHEA